jgi:hypothetical protein
MEAERLPGQFKYKLSLCVFINVQFRLNNKANVMPTDLHFSFLYKKNKQVNKAETVLPSFRLHYCVSLSSFVSLKLDT